FSESLPAMVGRPEAHAALYRLLARLGRAEDVARLQTLHETTARAGGWAAICDADDAIKAVGRSAPGSIRGGCAAASTSPTAGAAGARLRRAASRGGGRAAPAAP